VTNLNVEFECSKVIAIARTQGLTFIGELYLNLPTFEVFQKSTNGLQKIAVVQWTGKSWACISHDDGEESHIALEKVFELARSQYFWEIY
jgi:hypothetical protein